MGTGAQKTCSVCGNPKATTRTGVIKVHNRWDKAKKMMVPCKGSNRAPAGLLKRLLS